MSLFHDNALLGSSGSGADAYTIERSLRFNSGDSAYLSRSPSSAGNSQTFTLSWWMKRCDVTGTGNQRIFGRATGSNQFSIMHESNGRFYCYFNLTSPTDTSELTFDVKLVDPSAWYHCVMAFDTTQATDSNRIKFWLNGVLQNSNMATANWPSQNASFKWNEDLGGLNYFIGGISSFYTNTYLTEIHNVDGTALTADDFGEYSSEYPDVWNPKEYTGSYGTNGFYLNFSDPTSTTTISEDQSGQGNDWTANNISVSGTGTDSMLDSPTMGSQSDTGAGGEVSGNYATFNFVDKGNVTLSNGNLSANANIDDNVKGTLHIPEDVKIYFEFTVDQRGGGGSQSPIVGVCLNDLKMTQNADAQGSKVWAYAATGNKLGGGSQYASHGDSLSADDVLGVAIDRANGRIWFSKNGTWQNSSDPTDGSDSNAAFTNVPTTGILCFFYGNNNGTPGTGTLNCGQRAFSYNAPTDYKVLCTTSFNDSTIMDGGDYFDAITYTGTGTSQTITGLNFSPDLLWIKSRSSASNHAIWDTIRGVSGNLTPNTNAAEGSVAITSFDSNGFTLGDSYNGDGLSIVAWAWDTASSTVTNNSDGSITPTGLRANTTSGISIVTYRGTGSNATVGHGMNAVPKMYWIKRYSHTENWIVYHESMGQGGHIKLNDAGQRTTQSNIFNDTSPTSSVFSIGTNSQVNEGGNTYDYVAYLFAEVEGFSSFGRFEGTGSTGDAPFIYCGFKPAWILYKATDTNSAAADWFIRDYKREGFNHGTDANCNPELEANDTSTENNNGPIDICCNGFKIRSNNAGHNESGKNYIYAAFAEHPVKIARAR